MILLIWQWYEWMKPCACSFFFTQIVLTRWGCFIAGMSFACLDPPHHAHHVGSPVLTFFHIIQKAQFFRSGWSRPSGWLLGWSATGLGCLWKTRAMLNITSKLAPVAFFKFGLLQEFSSPAPWPFRFHCSSSCPSMPFGKAAEFEQFQMLMNEFESISERTLAV